MSKVYAVCRYKDELGMSLKTVGVYKRLSLKTPML